MNQSLFRKCTLLDAEISVVLLIYVATVVSPISKSPVRESSLQNTLGQNLYPTMYYPVLIVCTI